MDRWMGELENDKGGQEVEEMRDGQITLYHLQQSIMLCPIPRPICENPAGTRTQACENQEDIILTRHNRSFLQ